MPSVFALIEKVDAKLVYTFFTEALNFRLGTTGQNIADITATAASKNMSIEDVMAMVEEDGWQYYGEEPRDGLSYVCSAYVAAVWKAAGLFDPYTINATEFSPKDVYVVDFFEKDPTKLPTACAEVNGADVPYCQIMGKYQMTLPYYSTIQPYSQMMQACTINWPTYEVDPLC